jgi:hypothetical protein
MQVRTIRGWQFARLWLTSWAKRATWRSVLAVWLVLSAPLVLYVGHKAAAWLDGAWQVSGVLVGLVVAFMLFLLQSAAGQSLRTQAVYRAVLSSTFLVWPVVLALVFLAWIGVIERFSDASGTTPGFANTWLRGIFLVQLIGLLVVFVRLLSIVAPARVTEIVRDAFIDALRRSVETKLLRRVASNLLSAACDSSGIGHGLFGSGARVPASRQGWIDDVDLDMPENVAALRFISTVHLTVSLGDRAWSGGAIAQVDGPLGGELIRLLQHGVRVRRNRQPTEDPVEVFGEAVDIARRAVQERTLGALTSALELVAECMEELPRSYEMYGLPYTRDSISEGLGPTVETDLERNLFDFCRQVFASGNAEAAQQLPDLGYRLFRAGVRQNAPLLTQQGLDLWQAQVNLARGGY